jgi:hypothetical protein
MYAMQDWLSIPFSLHSKKKKRVEINRMENSAHVDLILHHVTG